jgi:hypothetical protein
VANGKKKSVRNKNKINGLTVLVFVSTKCVCPNICITNRYLRWQDILCSVTPVLKLINVLTPVRPRRIEDNICRLIINVKPEPKLIKASLPIAPTSSHAIANARVVLNPCRGSQQREKMLTCLRLSNLLSSH